MKEKHIPYHTIFYVGLIIIAALFVFFQLHVIVITDRTLGFLLYNYFSNQYITYLLAIITDFTLGSIYAPIIISLYFLYKKKKAELFFFVTSYLSLVAIRVIVQEFIVRQRPFLYFSNHPYLGNAYPLGSSFPSLHAMTAFFIAYIVSVLFKLKQGAIICLFIFALVVAVSRVYLGAHYPLDVVIGSILGLLWGHTTYHFFWKKFVKNIHNELSN